MPFRTERVAVPGDEAKRIFTAQAGDVDVQVRSAPLYENQGSTTYNFGVGGPELEEDRATALFCSDGQYFTAVSEGDELWAIVPSGSAAWTEQPVELRILIRSTPNGSAKARQGTRAKTGSSA